MPAFHSNQFHFDRPGLVFVADISDIGPGPVFERAYPDACDEGFRIISDRSGKELMFAVCEEKRDADGDILYWMLKPAVHTRDPLIDALRVKLFND